MNEMPIAEVGSLRTKSRQMNLPKGRIYALWKTGLIRKGELAKAFGLTRPGLAYILNAQEADYNLGKGTK